MAIKNINIAIEEELINIIDAEAKSSGRSRSGYIRFALEKYIETEKNSKITEQELKKEIEELKKQLIFQSAPQTPVVQPEEKKEKVSVPTKIPPFNMNNK